MTATRATPVAVTAPTGALPGRAEVQRRTLRALVIAQVFGGAGLAAGVSVGALLARDVLGSTTGAGLPAALFTAGSATAALLVGRLSQRHGRRTGLTAGYVAGAAGGAGVVVAGTTANVPLLLIALTVYGAGVATNLQCRYAGTDLADDAHRGRAVSTVLVATTAGAVAGPNLLQPTGDLAALLGLPRLTGPFLVAALAYAVAGAVLAALLRPDPLLVARQLAAAEARSDVPGAATSGPAAGATASLGPAAGAAPPAPVGAGDGRRSPQPAAAPGRAGRARPLVLAASGMVLAQAIMVAVMSMTPVHLEDHHHGLGVVGAVIGLHIGCMYLPSPLTGRLVDRYTPVPVVAAGGLVLLASTLVAAASGADALALATGLGLLGLGWNLTLVGGTALVTALTPLERRARTQGTVDVGVALAGATGGLSSGAILAAAGFQALGLVAALLALLILPGALAAGRAPQPAVP